MKHGVPVILVSCCVIHVVLFRQFVACNQQDVGEAIPTDTCKSVNILMASNVSTGIQVVVTSTEAGVDSSPTNLTIADRYLPPECQVNRLCDILHFGHPDGTSHYIIPSIRGFVVLYHRAFYNDNRTEEFPWNSFIGVIKNCNPTKAFLARNNRILVVACMDLQSRPKGMLYYMYYDILPNRTGSGWIIGRNTHLPTKSETIYNPATVSEIIHVRGQRKCPESDNLYLIDDEYALQFPTSSTSDPEFIVSGPLVDCVGYQSLEHYHGSDNLIVRCSNNRTALYDSCGTTRFTYAPDDDVPYPCSNWSTVAYRNGTQLTLDGETQLLPSDDIKYAKCVQGVNHPPVFIASSVDGMFISRFDGNNFTKIANGNCSADNNNGACPRPVFSENNDVFGTYDSTNDIFMIVNVTEGCRDDPIIAQIPTQFQPDLVSVSLGQGTYNCSCSALQSIGPGPLTTESAHISQTEHANSTMATHQTQSESLMESSPNPSPTAVIAVIVAVIAAVVAMIAVVSVSIIVCLVYRHRQSGRMKESMDFSPNVECPQQETSEKDFGNNPEDLGDGGYVTSDTPTTISHSESAGCISDGSECTVSIHSELGIPGGATGIPSKGILPLTSTQLEPEIVLQQYQSRTSDNDNSKDMDNKVHTFVSEDNNHERDNTVFHNNNY